MIFFSNAKEKTWAKLMQQKVATNFPEAVCQPIMIPINHLMRAFMDDQKEKYVEMTGMLGIVLKGEYRHVQGKPLMKRIMQLCICAAATVPSMMVTNLPSPRVAQKCCVEMVSRDQWTTRQPGWHRIHW